VTMAHKPALGVNVGKLIKGRTTKAEVMQLFGEPDVHAIGPESRANPNMPTLKGMREAGRAEEAAKMYVYSSIDPEQEAFFYVEQKGEGALGWIPLPMGGAVAGNVSYSTNKLLIFIDRKSGLVREFWYRQEFSPLSDK